MTAEEQGTIKALRDAYYLAGCPKGPACASQACLSLATTRVFWPVHPGKEYPLYCDGCAAWAVKVLETLGHRADTQRLPQHPDGAKRSLSLAGISEGSTP